MKQTQWSSGVVIVHQNRNTHSCCYLLLRCYGYWDFPKGIVEAGETSLAAACREVQEETGLSDLQFTWGQAFIDTARYGNAKQARYYLAASPSTEVTLLPNPQHGRIEHHEYRWLEYPDARKLLTTRLLPVIDWAHTLTAC